MAAAHKLLPEKDVRTSVIVTNLSDILVFEWDPWSADPQSIQYERVQAHLPALALRGVAMACLNGSTKRQYLVPPFRYEGPDTFHVLPEGPPTNPDVPLLPDPELLLSHTRCSDFDLATVVRDRARALQFFRWHEAVRDSALKGVVQVADIVRGTTHDISPVSIIPSLLFPLDPAQIPTDTQAHIDATRRTPPLSSSGLESAFAQSGSFELRIDELIAGSGERTMCTVYRCHLVALDGAAIESSPPLCLKLFDDRLQALKYPRPEAASYREPRLPYLFAKVRVAEQYALDEKLAYDKMAFVQGSLLPWFYGMHRVSFVVFFIRFDYYAHEPVAVYASEWSDPPWSPDGVCRGMYARLGHCKKHVCR